MMLSELFTTLSGLGIELGLNGEALRIRAPKGALTPELRAMLAERKEEILAFLRQMEHSSTQLPPLVAQPRTTEMPLSFAQEEIWLSEQFAAGESAFIVSSALQLTGSLDIATLEACLNEIISRHEALRTTFRLIDGRPTQVISTELRIGLQVVDLQADQHTQEEQSRTLMLAEAHRPFDLANGPLIRAQLFKLAAQEHLLHLALHHIIFDAWSIGCIMRELAALYPLIRSASPMTLPPPPIQYADFAAWQREQLQDGRLEAQLSYWKQQLAHAAPVHQLPTDRPRGTAQVFRRQRLTFQVSQELTQALQQLGRAEGTTLFATLLAAFNVLLWRYSGQQETLVGIPTSGRSHPHLQELIASFAYPVVMRARVQPDQSFRAVVQQVRDVVLAAYANQDVPFAKVVEALQPERVASATPLFQVMFSFPPPMADVEAAGLRIRHRQDLLEVSAGYDLALGMVEEPHGCDGLLIYNPQLFDAATIAGMVEHLLRILTAMGANPDQALSSIAWLDQADLQRLRDWADPPAQTARLADLFAAQARRLPDHPAVSVAGETITYADLQRRVEQRAQQLHAWGIVEGDRVGLCAEHSLAGVVSLLALVQAGATIVPLSSADPSAWHDALLQDAQARLVLATQASAGCCSFGALPVLSLDDLTELRAGDRAADRQPASSAQPRAIYMLSHGGAPVATDEAALVKRISWLQRTIPLSTGELVLHHANPGSDRYSEELLWPLLSGAHVAIGAAGAALDSQLAATDASTLWVDQQELEQLLGTNGAQPALPATVRRIVCSGAAAQTTLEWAGQLDLADVYVLLTHPAAAAPLLLRHMRPNATAVPRFTATETPVYALDQHDQLAPLGLPGRLCFAADALVDGYAALFARQPIPQLGGRHVIVTGEQVRMLSLETFDLQQPAARYAWSAGRFVDLGMLADKLNHDPMIHESVVLARQDAGGCTALIAYVTSASPLAIHQLLARLRLQLPTHFMPAAVVQVSTLPLTTAGQVDRQALERLPVIEPTQVAEYEAWLRSQPGTADVAVTIQPTLSQPQRLHLADLLPAHGQTSQAQGQRLTPAASASHGAEAQQPAISHGGALLRSAADPRLLVETLQRAAEQAPDRGVTYISSDGSTTFQPYPELLSEAERVLAGLRAQGRQPQDIVIFQLDQHRDFIPALWGCILGGFVPAPLATAPNYSEANAAVTKLGHAWEMLGHPLVVTSEELQPQLESAAQMLGLEGFRSVSIGSLRTAAPDHHWHRGQEGDLALLMLTSGSTGNPKGVMLNHHNLISRALGSLALHGFSTDEVTLNWMPLDHVAGIIYFHLRDVFLGCQQIHAQTQLVLQNPLRWLDWIEQFKATITFAPNFAFGLVNNLAAEIGRRTWDLASMRLVLNGAEAIVAKTARRFLELLAPHGLSPEAMTPAWGMSETSSGVVYGRNFRLATTSDDMPFVEVGVPIPGIALRIVDAQNRVVNEGVVGRLQVQGATVTSGYYRNQTLNDEVFTEDGWFNTGDQGIISAGQLTITGREKDDIVINSVNYYSHEIEGVVESLPGIEPSFTAACAVRRPGSDTDTLAIFFNTTLSEERLPELLRDIRRSVVQKIGINPEFLVPVAQADIPKTSIGKLQRSQLAREFIVGTFDATLKQIDLMIGNAHTVPAWFYRPIWRPKALAAQPRPAGALHSLVFLDQQGLGTALCGLLQASGHACVVVEQGPSFTRKSTDHYVISPTEPEHYRQLLDALADDGCTIDQLVHLWSCDDIGQPIDDGAALARLQAHGAQSLLSLAQALAVAQRPLRLLVVSRSSQPVLPAEPLALAATLMAGMIQTLGQEMAWLDCRHLDLAAELTPQDAGIIMQELWAPTADAEVAYRQGQRWISRLEQLDLQRSAPQPSPLKARGIYLLTGGLGALGSEFARYLLTQYQARLLIVGRSPLAEPHADDDGCAAQRRKKFEELQSIEGGQVAYYADDLGDPASIRRIVEEQCQHWGAALDGVIHLAGVYEERLLADETPETLVTAFQPKVAGLLNLHLALGDRQPLFINISSVNSFFGGIGAGAYAAANRFVERFTWFQRHQAGYDARCYAWSMWDDLGVSQGYQMKELSASRGYMGIAAHQGVQSWAVALHQPDPMQLIGLDQTKPHIQRYTESRALPSQQISAYVAGQPPSGVMLRATDRFGVAVPCQLVLVPEIPRTATGEVDSSQLMSMQRQQSGATTEHIPPKTELEQRIAAIWQEVLKMPRVGINDNFFDLGGQSIMLVQVFGKLKELKPDLDMVELFKYPTIAALAAYMSQEPAEQRSTQQTNDRVQARKAALERQKQQRQKQRTTK